IFPQLEMLLPRALREGDFDELNTCLGGLEVVMASCGDDLAKKAASLMAQAFLQAPDVFQESESEGRYLIDRKAEELLSHYISYDVIQRDGMNDLDLEGRGRLFVEAFLNLQDLDPEIYIPAWTKSCFDPQNN